MNPTPEQLDEMKSLIAKTQAWIDGLQVAGMDENTIVTAVHSALVQRALRAGGVTATIDWLQGQADMVAAHGADLLADLRRQGH